MIRDLLPALSPSRQGSPALATSSNRRNTQKLLAASSFRRHRRRSLCAQTGKGQSAMVPGKTLRPCKHRCVAASLWPSFASLGRKAGSQRVRSERSRSYNG